MALSNRERVHDAIELLRVGLTPFVERMFQARLGETWPDQFDQSRRYPLKRNSDGSLAWDSQALLKAMADHWRSVFESVLGRTERALVGELSEVRNAFAHEQPFSSDDTLRALDSAKRLLDAVSAKEQADAVDKSRLELQRTVFAEQARQQTRRKSLNLEGTPKAGLQPWREVITPHPDVSSGRYQQAEFAADLAQVHRGEGSNEYRDPVEFFGRTYLTEGLENLLKTTLRRLSGRGGDPVVQTKTSFGGGKTHAMLAAYHLVGVGAERPLPGIEPLMAAIGIDKAPKARRAVIVGTALSPGQPDTRPDGTVIRTLWGQMAWQLGGAPAYQMIAEADANGTSPGSAVLAELFEKWGPCLVLIDEWVAFVRQLYHVNHLPAGSFDANLTFVQALTEAAKAASTTLVIASLPASQIEIGGEGGQAALARLQNTFSRVESTWRPATADEGFEIVRRRLFQPITESAHFAARDAVIRAFSRLYQDHRAEFPQGCPEGDYLRRMELAYPIHPELFDRLYQDWGGLDRFQRTRGVLRLMAAVIHALWSQDDRSLMIVPASIPIDLVAVQSELTRYMEESWDAVLARDVDGDTSLPLRIDKDNPNLGRYSATRRVARTLYMGSAPGYQGQNPGIDDRQVKLGCTQPGEAPATFGDALRRLANSATYLHSDGARYWYSTQPSLKRLADDRAAQLDVHEVWAHLIGVLREETGSRGEFAAVHPVPASSGDVPDEPEARLVIIGPEHPQIARDEQSPALVLAREVLATRGNSPRLYQNMVVFLAPDKQRLHELEEATRFHLAWMSIANDGSLDLTQSQTQQVKARQKEMRETVGARIRETWAWLLVPSQADPRAKVEWLTTRLQGQEEIVTRASKKLVHEEALITKIGPARLSIPINSYLWGGGNHVGTKKLWDYFASYLYLPRLRDKAVLAEAIREGISKLFCEHFAYAEGYDEATERYLGLVTAGGGSVVIDSSSVVVKPEVARRQEEADQAARVPPSAPGEGAPYKGDGGGAVPPDGKVREPEPRKPILPKRFFGSVELNPDRLGKEAGRIAEEVLQHLSTLRGAQIQITLEIEATLPSGVAEETQRIVTENCQTLRFSKQGFERS
jgi:hypothetical protein